MGLSTNPVMTTIDRSRDMSRTMLITILSATAIPCAAQTTNGTPPVSWPGEECGDGVAREAGDAGTRMDAEQSRS